MTELIAGGRFLRPPARGPAALPRATAGAALAGRPVLPRGRLLRAAAAHVHHARARQVPTDERGLPDPQRRQPPMRRRTAPLPVMVFIHGGGYFLGSSATPIYDGAALARQAASTFR